MYRYYGKKPIILLDEYDTPLQEAYIHGFWNEITAFIRKLFNASFKTNPYFDRAVLTGITRISKESVFSDLINPEVITATSDKYTTAFGFTQSEVTAALQEYGLTQKEAQVKDWYDGFTFGSTKNIYNPWSIINYLDKRELGSYWVNTSSNSIIRSFLSRANATTKNEIEQLINGKSVKKRIHQELTYRDLDSKLDHLWSILFTTGYLTQSSTQTGDFTELVIPNKEIQWIFVEQIRDWFDDETTKNRERLENFCKAFEENNVLAIENGFHEYLEDMISIRDTNVRKGMKENFYHGLLLGILGNMDNWIVQSNAESGDGYSDISIEIRRKGVGIVIELKYAENGAFEEACKEAMEQINERNYEKSLEGDGMTTIYKYGIACYKKRCKVISG